MIIKNKIINNDFIHPYFCIAKEKNNLFTLSLDWVLRLFLIKRYATQTIIYIDNICAYLFFLFKLDLNKKATLLLTISL